MSLSPDHIPHCDMARLSSIFDFLSDPLIDTMEYSYRFLYARYCYERHCRYVRFAEARRINVEHFSLRRYIFAAFPNDQRIWLFCEDIDFCVTEWLRRNRYLYEHDDEDDEDID